MNEWEGCCKAKTSHAKGAKKRFQKLYGKEMNSWKGCRQVDASEIINRHLPRMISRPGGWKGVYEAPYAVMGLTSEDMYAGASTAEGGNHYTGGLTDMMGRTGVFSFARPKRHYI